MGITERREREKLELRQKILVKAKDILLSQGWTQLSIRNIAKAIEYSPATIYSYYEGKDEIVYELMELGFSELQHSMQPAFLIEHTITRLHQIGISFIKFGLANPEWFGLLFATPKPVCNLEKYLDNTSPGFQIFDLLVANCQEAIDKKFTKITDAQILAMLLWSSVQGLVILIRSKHIEILVEMDEQTLIQQTMDTLMENLFDKKQA